MEYVEIYVPKDYCLLDHRSQSWVPVHLLSKNAHCWGDSEFVDILVEQHPSSKEVDCYANIDCVTTIGLLKNTIKEVLINYHWMPPWLNNECCSVTQQTCSESNHSLTALIDFLPNNFCNGHYECKLSHKRYERIKHIPIFSSLKGYSNKRYQILHVPIQGKVCESANNEQCRYHALSYINTVLAVKAHRVPKSKTLDTHYEIKDRGILLSGGSFRRLRRLMALCAVKNHFIPKVYRLGDGLPVVKRRMRLKFAGGLTPTCLQVKEKVHNNAHYNSLMGRSPYFQRAQLIEVNGKKLPIVWYKVTILKGTSLAIEGVMIRLNTYIDSS